MRLAASVALACGACGRVGFSARGDGAVGDGPPAEAASDVAPVCSTSFQLCDGFEAPTFAPYWTPSATGVSIDSTIAHRGTHSVHIHSEPLPLGTSGFFQLTETETFNAGTVPIYIRAYVRLGGLPASTNPMELISVDETLSPSYGDVLFVRSTGLEVYTQWTDTSASNNVPPSQNTWFCVLFEVLRSTTTGTLALGGDVSATFLANMPTDGAPPVDALSFEIGFASQSEVAAQPSLDVWFDDVIVNDAPLTCAD